MLYKNNDRRIAMQVSQPKKLPRSFSRTPVAAGIVLALAAPALQAQQAALEEITVTAQKRAENLQDVPISISILDTQSIKELNLTNFKDYTEMLPSVAIQRNLASGAGFARVYMRGIATSGDGQATTSLPSVGMYLDELSMTTIQGNIDVHMYDVARVEALAGPQGTLYGASSQAGTLRVITNKPEIGEFSSSVSAGVNSVDEGGTGFTVEGYVNAPIGDNAAVRLVGWSRNDAGWIDNVLGSRTFPGVEDPAVCAAAGVPCSADDITLTNTDKAKKDYNTLDTIGARAALRIDLNDNWTISPTLMYQKSESEGAWADDLSDFVEGDYAVTHFKDEFFDDEWYMIGLTIEGSIGNFDVVYAGSYLDRDVQGSQDYSDYSYWYDTNLPSGYYSDLHFSPTGPRAIPNYFVPAYFDAEDVGSRVMTGAAYTNDDGYTKENHELRISTDPTKRVRGLVGVFWQHQFHDFEQHWEVEGGVAPTIQMNGGDPRFEDTVYLNSMFRNDRDTAFFGSVSFDITDALELTVGVRFFEPEVTVKGFFGFPAGWIPQWGTDGETQCDADPARVGTPQEERWDAFATADFNGQTDWEGKPCLNVDKGQKESGNVGRFNLTWNVSDDSMVYFTWSEGYRPGGIQRRPSLGEYLSDFLTNVEVGWKTQWADNRFQFNGAVFTQDWDDIQIGLTGENAITLVDNGPSASVDGIEFDLLWLATDSLRISAAASFYDSQLEDDYCCESDDVTPLAPAGTRLPLTADFKGNVVARYHFDMGSFDSYLQGALVYQADRDSRLARFKNDIIGVLPSYTTLDISGGFGKDDWSVDLFIANVTGEDATLFRVAECIPSNCGVGQVYGARVQPTTISARFTKDFN
jgi:outer membrane receptor protein involved in Fe transport